VRVLIVNDYGTPTGGAELKSLRIRDLLRERGHEALMFTSDARPVSVALESDVRCFGTQGRGRNVLQAANPWAAAKLRRTIASFRPDVVHLRMFLSQLSPLILPVLRNTPTLLHVVNYQLICPLNTKVLPDGTQCGWRAGDVCREYGCVSALGQARFAVQRRMWEMWGDAVDMMVANSRWTAGRLAADGFDVAGAVTYGVTLQGPRPPLSPEPVVVFVGRLFKKKGVDVLLRAMSVVRAAVPNARLRIVGDGPEQATLRQLVSELSLDDAVTMIGFVPNEELGATVGDAWVQVVPSVWEEPFGLVTIEAMMRGTAVIASSTGGPSEVVRYGETGLLVTPNDAQALASAIIDLLRDRELVRTMGARAYEIAQREFTEEAMMARVLGLYETTMTRFREKRSRR
jgi:glycosyltransferase involved in cell wall biosynthesis